MKDGSLDNAKKKAEETKFADRIHLTGPIPKADVPLRLSEADVFLNTSNVDNAPVSILEAMATGLCIVTTNVGGISYLLKDGYDALLVPPNDPEAMSAAVRLILREPGLAGRLSHNAREKAERFDWAHILPEWESLLNAVAEGRLP